LRERVLAVRPRLLAQAPGPAQNRLVRDLEGVLATLDDLGIGCDLAAQPATVAAVIDRAMILAGSA
jgi:hypothetical protein